MHVRRLGLAAAEVVREHGAHAPVYAAVELEEVRVFGERRRELDQAGDPVDVVALVDVAKRLVVDELDAVPVSRQRLHDDLLADKGSRVLRHQYLWLVAPHEVDRLGPEHRVPRGGAADGVEVRECSVDVVSGEEDLPVRPPDVDLVVGLAGRVNQLECEAAFGDGQSVREHVGCALVLRLCSVLIYPEKQKMTFLYICRLGPGKSVAMTTELMFTDV